MNPIRQRALFIANNSIGDAVLASGLVRNLVETQPEAFFTIVAGPASAPLFAETPRLERLIALRKKPFNRHWLDLWLEIRGRRWTTIVDMRGSFLAYLLAAEERRVYRPIRRASGSPPIHRVLDAARLARDAAQPPAPFLYTNADHEACAEKLVGGGPVLALAPVAKTPAKTWPPERFAEAAAELIDRRGPLVGGRVLLTGAAADAPACAPIRAAVAPERVIDLLGLDLLTTYACLKRVGLYIGNDSGLMHLAAAAGAPTLGLFGDSDEKAYRPWGELTASVRAGSGPDGPGDIADLSVARVVEVALGLLERARAQAGESSGPALSAPPARTEAAGAGDA